MTNTTNVFLPYAECVIKIEDLGEHIFKLLSKLNSFSFYNDDITRSTYKNGIECRYKGTTFLHFYNEEYSNYGSCAIYDIKSVTTALLVFKKDLVLTFGDSTIDVPEWSDIKEELYFQLSTVYNSFIVESLMLFSYIKKYSTVYFKLDLEYLFLLDVL